MISWISLLIMLSTFNTVLNNIVTSMCIYEDTSDNPVLDFYQSHRFVWFTFVDFLKGMTMVYLFYKQGQFFLEYMQHRKMKGNQLKQSEIEPVPQNILDDLKFSVIT